ncbi:L,D-transpeptidase [Streptomyces sp. NPDC026672]|uniref:L,D-transpeptidase n=1 Tax=unclassified Streptomyces TaxID=2593676 RepID=UPI0033DBB147
MGVQLPGRGHSGRGGRVERGTQGHGDRGGSHDLLRSGISELRGAPAAESADDRFEVVPSSGQRAERTSDRPGARRADLAPVARSPRAVPHAMRLSTSGIFIHGNYWAPDSVFGHANVSHGCVGLNDVRGGGDSGQDASWFYNNSLLGDVVVVERSHDHTIAPANGLNGWNMAWDQ